MAEEARDLGPIALTGGAGFLGSSIVDAAVRAGVRLRVLLRPGQTTLPGGPRPGVEVIGCGLDDPRGLEEAFRGCSAVIHAAAAMSAGDAEHEERTIEPTRRVVAASVAAGVRRFVLVSSMSVYAFGEVPRGGELTEDTPRFGPEEAPQLDAYARAKRAQEEAVEEAMAAHPGLLDAVFLRPGAIHGPGREWTARLGFRRGPLAVRIGSKAAVPLIAVDACGEAVLRAATVLSAGDPDASEPRVFNLFADRTPTQKQWLQESREAEGVRVVVPVPLAPLLLAGKALHPMMGNRLPGIFRPAAARARFVPMRFPNDRAKKAGLL